jgi:EmrB/QacA subfamily drug resistance transporter
MIMSVSTSVAPLATGDRRRWAALVVVCLAQLMSALDSTIVNVALPAIQHDLHFGQAGLTWVVNAYLVAFGSLLLMAGRLGDLVGRRRVFLGGVVLFTAASMLCAVVPDQALLVTARFVQGAGAALSASVIVAIIVTEFSDPLERARAMGIYVFVAVAGGSIGLLVGGTLTQAVGWHWIFLINAPIGVVALLLGARLITENEGIGLDGGVDVAGSALVTAALMVGICAIVGSGDHPAAWTLGLGGAAVVLLAGFLVLESRLANPIMPLRILRLRSLTGSSAVRGLAASGMFASFFLGALYLERALGYGPTRTGLAFVPQTLTVAALSLGVTSWLMQRFGPRATLTAGMGSMVAGLALLARAGGHASYFPDLFVAFVLVGLGGGTTFMPLLSIAMSDVPPRDAGLASGIVNVSMQLSGAIGLAVTGAIAASHGTGVGLMIAAGCVAAGLLTSLVVLRPRDAIRAA